ncbi:uncharacterized protein LOC108088721 [Drosophila ficusphila]|uniref:uncharacterized protein LOC108088721 n=1 Tax=Drosophila ficusphila TaxID=30025 RepID=UPI0007E7F6E6|nr:uncharacterized protein LOC108088721 [Drosophila ficusphila]
MDGKRLQLVALLVALFLAGISARPKADNPLESLGMSAMNLAGNLAEAIQSGGALTRDLNLDNPLMSVHSKTALGYGDAMRPPSGADSSEEDRRRKRRRRRRRSGRSGRSLHRHRRAPCFWKMGGAATTAATGGDDEVEARRRRAQKRATNNASRSRVSPKTSGKKSLQRRRRRQAPTDTEIMQNSNGKDPLGLGDRIKGMWLAFVDNVSEVVQQVRQKISDSATQTG